MKLIPLFCGLILLTQLAMADESATVYQPSPVLLKSDGTWEFVSPHHFATDAQGQRYQLNRDGTWQPAGETPVQVRQQLRNTNKAVLLEKVTVEIQEKQASSVRKNKRQETQTVFQLQVNAAIGGNNQPRTIRLSKEDLKAEDNRGKDYSIVSIEPAAFELKPGQPTSLQVRVDESLRWGAKAMTLTFNKAVFGTDTDLTFTATPLDMTEVKVDRFGK